MTETVVAEEYGAHEWAHRSARVMVRGNTRSTVFVSPAPPYAVHGEGSIIVDQLGRTVIDANNNYTSLIHGHSQPEITRAVSALLASGTAFGLPTSSAIDLAELLTARTGYQRWRFSNSGTEAVMTAIRAARAFTGRDVVVRFTGSYHGTADAVVGRTAPGITEGVRSDVIEVPQGDAGAFEKAIAEHGRRIACVLIDLMPNRAGMIPASADFVDLVRNRTDDLDALLIVDEVISLRMAVEGLAGSYGITPDLITAGKIIGGGFPVGAVGGRADVLSVFDPGVEGMVDWGGTFSANPISMTAGHIALSLFDEASIAALNERGERLHEALAGSGVHVSGRGSLLRLREDVDPTALWWAAYERGVLLGTNGLVALATSMSDDQLAAIEAVVVQAVRSVRGRR